MSVQFSDLQINPNPLRAGKPVKVTCRITSPAGIESVKLYDPRGWTLLAYDDGTHGDDVAGDSVYTVVEQVPYDAPPGDYVITAVVSDKTGDTVHENLTVTIA